MLILKLFFIFDYFEDSKEQEELVLIQNDLSSDKLSLKDNKPHTSAKIILSIIVFLLASAMLYAFLKIIKNKKKF